MTGPRPVSLDDLAEVVDQLDACRVGVLTDKVVARFLQRVSANATGCWPWIGARENRYGRLWVDGHNHPAHRISYELFRGPIPADLVVDHVCHDPADCAGGAICPHRYCVNPDHLEAVTLAENSRRAHWGLSNRCKRGHELTPENTRIERRGGGRVQRRCVACRRASWRARYRRQQKLARMAARGPLPVPSGGGRDACPASTVVRPAPHGGESPGELTEAHSAGASVLVGDDSYEMWQP